jgi:hypothetical protein
MAERSQFWATGTTGDGTVPISQNQTLEWIRDLFTPHTASGPNPVQGILYGVGGNLRSSGSTSPLTVATGAAIIEGFYYKNDAPVNISVPISFMGRTDLIVLRANWATRQVRLALLLGVEGSPSTIPALTQIAGTTWEIAIARLDVTPIAFNVTNLPEAFARPVGSVSLLRQGGSATQWDVTGTTNYLTPQPWIIQTGVRTATGTTLIVTFPAPFAQPPIVIAPGATGIVVASSSFSATVSSAAITQWIAIGPILT